MLIKNYLEAKGLEVALTRERGPEPTGEADKKLWLDEKKAFSQARFLVVIHLKPEIMIGMHGLESPKQVWDRLQTSYAQGDRDSKMDLEDELHDTKYKEGTQMADHVSKIKNIYELPYRNQVNY
jgi:gag-polypeptide of LTR copia-type